MPDSVTLLRCGQLLTEPVLPALDIEGAVHLRAIAVASSGALIRSSDGVRGVVARLSFGE